MAVKSTRTLGYSIKGDLDMEMLTVTEYDEEQPVVHDLSKLLGQFDGQEISISFNNKVKLEDGVE